MAMITSLAEARAARAQGEPDAVAADGEPSLSASDGAVAALRDGAIELRDPGGRVLARYVDGALEIAPSAGDLRLSAPSGRVVLAAGMDICFEAERDVTQRAGRAFAVDAPRLAVTAHHSRVVTGEAQILARRLETSAEIIAARCARYELEATKLIERSCEAFREVAGLAESRLGRARTVVEGVHALFSRRNVMVSREETSVDGSRVLLG